MNDGSLTEEQFQDGIDKFAKKCKSLNENWYVRHVQHAPDQRYLEKRQTTAVTFKTNSGFQNVSGDTEEYLVEDTFDNAECSNNTEQLVVTFEYHVVYSPSYKVPVLYFSAWTQDGKLLSLDDIWKQVPEIHREFLNFDKWSFITQQEHPLLQRPYFLVHPCHTAVMMKQLLANTSGFDTDSSLYLTAWLSAVGPAVGIQLPLEFGISQSKQP